MVQKKLQALQNKPQADDNKPQVDDNKSQADNLGAESKRAFHPWCQFFSAEKSQTGCEHLEYLEYKNDASVEAYKGLPASFKKEDAKQGKVTPVHGSPIQKNRDIRIFVPVDLIEQMHSSQKTNLFPKKVFKRPPPRTESCTIS